jgi:hypothetical protein
MSYEIWDGASGNLLAEFDDIRSATTWLLEVWSRSGPEVICAFELGSNTASRNLVVSGPRLVEALRDLVWRPQATVQSAATSDLAAPRVSLLVSS